MKKETGFDFKDAKLKVAEFSGRAVDSAKSGQILLQHFQSELFPEFLNWNKFESWKVNFLISPHFFFGVGGWGGGVSSQGSSQCKH